MKKVKIIVGIVSVAVIIAVGALVYVAYGSRARENHVREYLANKGYAASQVQSVQAKHAFLNPFLGYPAWGVSVVFVDEPNMVYSYRYDRETGVKQAGVSGGDKDTRKEELKHVEP